MSNQPAKKFRILKLKNFGSSKFKIVQIQKDFSEPVKAGAKRAKPPLCFLCFLRFKFFVLFPCRSFPSLHSIFVFSCSLVPILHSQFATIREIRVKKFLFLRQRGRRHGQVFRDARSINYHFWPPAPIRQFSCTIRDRRASGAGKGRWGRPRVWVSRPRYIRPAQG